MNFNAIRTQVSDDLCHVDTLIQERLHSDVALVRELAYYITNSGGKRIRPLLTVLVGRLLGIAQPERCQLATIIEFIHTATLLHDDVVDESALRRGQETANAVFGNAASVLVGDFLYTRAFQMMTELKSQPVLDIMAHATNKIAEGEVMQLMNCGCPDVTEARYMDVIYCKTAKLFEAACSTPSALVSLCTPQAQALTRYGMYLGTAFQLMDDVIDYTSDADTMGKNLGDDLAEGKPTLPLIYAQHHGSEADQNLIRTTIEKGAAGESIDMQAVLAVLQRTEALAYCQNKAQVEADKAIAEITHAFPQGIERDALCALAHLAVHRQQ